MTKTERTLLLDELQRYSMCAEWYLLLWKESAYANNSHKEDHNRLCCSRDALEELYLQLNISQEECTEQLNKGKEMAKDSFKDYEARTDGRKEAMI